ncbi:hypothetical protein K432DRAFT_393421 [Lepidopterella palustris CBS 459.81]|uniref:Uncharacterized protein n=1 Tax=Lepidopterella palustris CBS 459.81 TaxID=1314670 RepID=A0A8E2EA47_9PEZI|nr:hypothetical protein K432DRAFT_393421 [Lepidopterella palustris CBS 459.81]
MRTSLSLLAATLLGLLAICNARPTVANTLDHIIIRSASDSTCQVTLCTDPFFGGECVVVVGPAAQCISMSEIGPDYINTVSTFGIDDGCICSLVNNPNCYGIGNGLSLSGSGEPNLAGRGWDNQLSSYVCNR